MRSRPRPRRAAAAQAGTRACGAQWVMRGAAQAQACAARTVTRLPRPRKTCWSHHRQGRSTPRHRARPSRHRAARARGGIRICLVLAEPAPASECERGSVRVQGAVPVLPPPPAQAPARRRQHTEQARQQPVRISVAPVLFFAFPASGHFCASGSGWIFISLDGGTSRLGSVDFP
jgi:hypothetical protein